MPGDLIMWTIYDHPRDYPDSFVAHKWIIRNGQAIPTDEALESTDLCELRKKIPPGLYRMARDASDDPTIIETWL